MPSPHSNKPHNQPKTGASFVVRVNRAANDLNPFLVVVVVGLLLLNLTFYLGMAISQPHGTSIAMPASPEAPGSTAISGRM
jgi:hypothetical protein